MIARHWKGIARRERAEDYVRYLQEATFPKLSDMDGFLYAAILKKETNRGIEFLVISHWQSIEAIRQFSGDAQVAVVPPEIQAMMLEYDREVELYEIAQEFVPL